MKNIYLYIVTLGPVGYMSAPGTMATVVTLPFVYMLHTYVPDFFVQVGVIAGLFAIGMWLVRQTLRLFNMQSDDPSEIVYDEFIGCLITFCGITLSMQTVIIGFILFRFLDIFKFGFKFVEQLNGEWGIMIDDIIAALIANIVLQFLF